MRILAWQWRVRAGRLLCLCISRAKELRKDHVAHGAYYDGTLGQFILPYDAVRRVPDPAGLLLGFLQETYDAAAELAHWERKALERVTVA